MTNKTEIIKKVIARIATKTIAARSWVTDPLVYCPFIMVPKFPESANLEYIWLGSGHTLEKILKNCVHQRIADINNKACYREAKIDQKGHQDNRQDNFFI